MARVRADLGRRPGGTRSVVLAHAFVAGAEPSDSERDISVGGVSIVPDHGLRRRRLRRSRPPARARHPHRPRPLQRLAARLLLLRGPAPQGQLAGRPRRRRGVAARRVRRRARAAAARPAHRRARRPAGRPRARRATSSPGSRRRSPTTPGPLQAMERLRRRFPHALVLVVRARPTPSLAPRPPRAPTAAATTTSRSTSSPTCAASRPPTTSPRLLRDACDACCDDRDLDTLVAGGA